MQVSLWGLGLGQALVINVGFVAHGSSRISLRGIIRKGLGYNIRA